MATIAGPSIQIKAGQFTDETGQLTVAGLTFLHSVQQATWNSTRSGPTASRPTSSVQGRWIGMQFYDTTLGKAIFLHSVNPDVWHDGAGSVV